MYQLNYNFLTFYLIFYIYCFLGWCFESCYVSLKSRKWINRGFMKGPFLPIYGTGAVIILFATIPFMENPLLVYFMAFISATVLEFVTGVVMEKLFKVKYWDYSNNFMNYKGYICIKSSITWGFMGLFITYIVNEPIALFIESLSQALIAAILAIITVIFAADFIESFKNAYDLREMIMNNTRLMAELNEIKIQINEAVDEAREQANERKEALIKEIKEKINTALSYTEIDEYIIEKIDEIKNLDIDVYIAKWKDKTNQLKERIERLDNKRLAVLKRNPSAKSKYGFIKEIRELTKRSK